MYEELMTDLIIFFYIFAAIFFAVISKKCFISEKPVRKVLGSVILSPSSGYFISFLITLMVEEAYGGDEAFFNSAGGITYAVASTAVQLAIQLIFMFLYIKLIRSVNPSIAMFVYLCSMLLIPSILYIASFNDASRIALLLLYTTLHILFYIFAVRPLTHMTRIKQQTDKRIFILLPGINFLFNTVIFVLFMYSYYMDGIGENFAEQVKFLKNADENVAKVAYDIVIMLIGNLRYDLYVLILPSIFVTIVTIATFSIIVKNIKYMNETIQAKDEIKELSVEVMEALAHTIDAKDEYTRGHSIRVAQYSRMIAEKMGLSDEQCENIYYMGLLHDLGKIGVPNDIINKPGKLNDEEYETIKTHPMTGYDILAEIKSRPDLAIGARWHHEKIDGTGYPDHKKGEEIPLEARIIAVADCYDAMTSNRSYRRYLDQEAVREELKRVTGTQLDSAPVEAMLSLMDDDKDYRMHE